MINDRTAPESVFKLFVVHTHDVDRHGCVIYSVSDKSKKKDITHPLPEKKRAMSTSTSTVATPVCVESNYLDLSLLLSMLSTLALGIFASIWAFLFFKHPSSLLSNANLKRIQFPSALVAGGTILTLFVVVVVLEIVAYRADIKDTTRKRVNTWGLLVSLVFLIASLTFSFYCEQGKPGWLRIMVTAQSVTAMAAFIFHIQAQVA